MKEPNSQFQPYAHPSQSNWNAPFPWQPFPSQPQNQSWQHGWQGTYGNHPQYLQYFPKYPPHPTPCHPYHSPPPQTQSQPHPSQISTLTQLSVPPFLNRVAQPTYNGEVQHFQPSPVDLNGIHLSSGRVSPKKKFS